MYAFCQYYKYCISSILKYKILLQTVTFQWLLITDGQSTFTVFNYIDVNLESIGNKKIIIGYQYKETSVKNQYSNTKRVFKMSENPGNRGKITDYMVVVIIKNTTQKLQKKNYQSCSIKSFKVLTF